MVFGPVDRVRVSLRLVSVSRASWTWRIAERKSWALSGRAIPGLYGISGVRRARRGQTHVLLRRRLPAVVSVLCDQVDDPTGLRSRTSGYFLRASARNRCAVSPARHGI